jgi:hypothetical protein
VTGDEPKTGAGVARGEMIRRWFATIVVILVVIAVWKFIDYRTQPPPPPNPVVPAKAP